MGILRQASIAESAQECGARLDMGASIQHGPELSGRGFLLSKKSEYLKNFQETKTENIRKSKLGYISTFNRNCQVKERPWNISWTVTLQLLSILISSKFIK